MQGLMNKQQVETGDGNIIIFPYNYYAIIQGTWVFSASTFHHAGIFYNSSSTIGDQVDYKLWLPAGAYVIANQGLTAENRGMAGYLIDSELVASFTQYSVGYPYLSSFVSIPFSILTSGIKTFSFKCLGSHGAALISFGAITFRRAGGIRK